MREAKERTELRVLEYDRGEKFLCLALVTYDGDKIVSIDPEGDIVRSVEEIAQAITLPVVGLDVWDAVLDAACDEDYATLAERSGVDICAIAARLEKAAAG